MEVMTTQGANIQAPDCLNTCTIAKYNQSLTSYGHKVPTCIENCCYSGNKVPRL